MTRRESVLLKILLLIICISAVFLYSFMQFDRISENENKRIRYTDGIKKMSEQMKASEQNESTSSLNSKAQERILEKKDISQIADKVLSDLLKAGITAEKYQFITTNKEELLEITLITEAPKMMRFLHQFTEKDFNYTIKYFSTKNVSEQIYCILRITNEPFYRTAYSNGRMYSSYKLAGMYPVPKVEKPIEEEPVIPEFSFNTDLFIIGEFEDSSNIKYKYLKNRRNGRVYKIPETNMENYSEYEYLIEIEGQKYVVSKK